MNFLDIHMIVQNDKIITDIYFKPTDTQNYVPFKSAHPRHTLINIPYNLARRLCTIVDEKTTLTTRLKELKDTLRHLGYPKTLIDNGLKKATEIPQEQLRTPKEKTQEGNILTFVSTNNPRNPNFYPIIKESISVINASPKMKRELNKTKLIPSKRQPQNLKRILTRAKFISQVTVNDTPKLRNARTNDVKPVNRLLYVAKLK